MKFRVDPDPLKSERKALNADVADRHSPVRSPSMLQSAKHERVANLFGTAFFEQKRWPGALLETDRPRVALALLA